MPKEFTCHPLTPDRWPDLVKLFGPKGACSGCWCMFFRLSRSEFTANAGEGNKKAFAALIKKGEVPGLIAYDGEEPAGWIAVAPRETFSALARSRVMAPVDDKPCWSIVCYFVARPYRQRGLMVELTKAAVGFARKQGAKIVEGYPMDAAGKQISHWDAYHGVREVFDQCGFKEVARRSPSRPVMRKIIRSK